MEASRNYNLNRVLDKDTDKFEAELQILVDKYAVYMDTETFEPEFKKYHIIVNQDVIGKVDFLDVAEKLFKDAVKDKPYTAYLIDNLSDDSKGYITLKSYEQIESRRL